MQHEAFVNGSFDTNFVSSYFRPDMLSTNSNEETASLAAMISAHILNLNAADKPVQNEVENTYVPKWRSRRFPGS
jgi:hypothetical protein